MIQQLLNVAHVDIYCKTYKVSIQEYLSPVHLDSEESTIWLNPIVRNLSV